MVLGLLVGSVLAVSGGAYQGVFRNPLADPYLLGVAAGAGLGATIAIVTLGAGSALIGVAAFGGALALGSVVSTLGADFFRGLGAAFAVAMRFPPLVQSQFAKSVVERLSLAAIIASTAGS